MIWDIFNVCMFVVVVVLNGKIIVVGGFSVMKFLKVMEVFCEMFDLCINEWSLVLSFVILCVVCGIVSIDDIIYLFGG